MGKFGKVNGVANYLDFHAWKCNGIYIYNSDCLNLDIGPTTLHRNFHTCAYGKDCYIQI